MKVYSEDEITQRVKAAVAKVPREQMLREIEEAFVTTDKMLDTPDGEIITGDTAHGVSFDKLKKVGDE